jgi:hypothetical protein
LRRGYVWENLLTRTRSIGGLQQEGESDKEALAVGESVGFVNGLVMRESDEEVLAVRELVGFDKGLSIGELVGFDKKLAVEESDKELSVGESVNEDKIGGLR